MSASHSLLILHNDPIFHLSCLTNPEPPLVVKPPIFQIFAVQSTTLRWLLALLLQVDELLYFYLVEYRFCAYYMFKWSIKQHLDYKPKNLQNYITQTFWVIFWLCYCGRGFLSSFAWLCWFLFFLKGLRNLVGFNTWRCLTFWNV